MVAPGEVRLHMRCLHSDWMCSYLSILDAQHRLSCIDGSLSSSVRLLRVCFTELTPQQDYHLLVASMTQRDTDWSSEAVAAALALLEDVDVAKEEAAKDSSWRKFWSKSELDLMTGSSELHDLEAWYYG